VSACTESLIACFPIAIERQRAGQFSQPFDIPHRRFAKVALVFAAEVGSVLVTDSVAGLRSVEVLVEHQPPGLLKPQLLLELQRTHRRHGLEVSVEPGDAHAELPRDVLDPQGLVEVLAQLLDRANHPVGVTAKGREVTHAAALRARQEAVRDLAHDERRDRAYSLGVSISRTRRTVASSRFASSALTSTAFTPPSPREWPRPDSTITDVTTEGSSTSRKLRYGRCGDASTTSPISGNSIVLIR
jgi:hypothetical protein